MKTIRNLFLLVAWMVLIRPANTQTLNLSLADALVYAEQHNSSVLNAQTDVRIEQEKRNELKARNLPKVNLSADARNNFQLATLLFPLPAGAGGTPGDLTPVQTGTRYNLTAAAEVTQNIFDLSNKGDRMVNQRQTSVAEAQTQQQKLNLKHNVAKAYYAVLLNQEKEKLNLADVERKSKLLYQARQRYKFNQGPGTDTLKAYINLKNAELLLSQAKQTTLVSKQQLADQIGAPLGVLVEVKDQLPQMVNSQVPANDTGSYQNHPDYRLESEQILLGEAQRTKIGYQYYPTVSAYGYYGAQAFRQELNFLDTKRSWYPVGYLGVKASWTLFDGFQKRSTDAQQQLNIAKHKASRTGLALNLAYQRVSALSNLRNAANNLKFQQENLKIAQTLFRIAQEKVVQQQGNEAEVIEAGYTVNQTEQLYLQSVYDFLVANLDYKKATGNL